MNDPAIWIAAASLAWNVGLTIHTLVGNDRRKVEEQFAELKKDLNGYGERLSRNEEKVDGMPSHDHLAEIHEKINAVAADLKLLTGASESNNDLLRAIHKRILDGNQ